MPHSPPPIYNVEHEEHVVNLDDPSPFLEQEFETQPNLIKEVTNFYISFRCPIYPQDKQ
jgi:hypothetical protein